MSETKEPQVKASQWLQGHELFIQCANDQARKVVATMATKYGELFESRGGYSLVVDDEWDLPGVRDTINAEANKALEAATQPPSELALLEAELREAREEIERLKKHWDDIEQVKAIARKHSSALANAEEAIEALIHAADRERYAASEEIGDAVLPVKTAAAVIRKAEAI